MQLCGDGSINIVIGNGEVIDLNEARRIFFDNANNDEPINFLPVGTRLPQLLKEVGIFPSTSLARKNGFDKDLPEGFSEITIGKKRTRICIWNPLPATVK